MRDLKWLSGYRYVATLIELKRRTFSTISDLKCIADWDGEQVVVELFEAGFITLSGGRKWPRQVYLTKLGYEFLERLEAAAGELIESLMRQQFKLPGQNDPNYDKLQLVSPNR